MSTLKADTIQSTSGGAATLTKQSAAKAYVRANEAVIQESQSFNVSSSTDHATGDYSHTLTNALSTRGVMVTTTRRTANGIISYMNEVRDSASVMAIRVSNTSNSDTDSRNTAVYMGDLA